MNQTSILAFFLTVVLNFSVSAQTQLTYPYNPDGDADGSLNLPDLLDFMAGYGNPFQPAEILIDSISLGDVIDNINLSISNLESLHENTSAEIQFNGVLETIVVGAFRYVNVIEIPNYGTCLGSCYRLHLPSPASVPDGFVMTIFDSFGSGLNSPTLSVYSTFGIYTFSPHTAKDFIKFGNSWYGY
jgi:hypothetical protein